MKIYIAGRYSGLDHQAAVDKFAETERQLVAAGIDPTCIINPMKLGIPITTPWDQAIAICMKHLKKCKSIFIQKDWKDSFGARKEITYADQNNYDLYWEDRGDIKRIKALIEIGACD